jgi:cytochrome c biogenesis protein CcdA
VVAFYSSTCRHCEEAKKALQKAQQTWGDRVAVEHRDVQDARIFAEMFRYEDHYGSTAQAPPKVFVGEQFLEGYPAIAARLQEVIAHELEAGSVTFEPRRETVPQTEEVPSGILDRFGGLSIGAVAVAGLLDGVNPCAFTTVVFLLSMLAYLGKSRRQLAVVGGGFTAAVFATYLLLGLGVFGFLEFIKRFSVASGISVALTYAVGLLALALGVWSFGDFLRVRRSGDVNQATLGLPKGIKQRIHKVIRENLGTRGLFVGSLTIGLAVAVLESLCTGQVYLPTIIFVARSSQMKGQAVAYLVFYNLMFIAPLVGVLVIAYFGVKSDRLATFLRRHLALLKLAMALLFLGLGVLVLMTV